MNAKRKHVVLSEQLGGFLTQATERELLRLRQIEALKAAAGAWKDDDHPELKQGSANWVRKLRQGSEHRFKKAAAR